MKNVKTIEKKLAQHNKPLFSLLFLCCSVALLAQNPFITDQFSADPTARVFEGKMYVYPSHDIPAPADKPHLRQDWFCMADYHVFSSENLTEWTDHGMIVSQETAPWVKDESYTMWAPDCMFRNGKYYFYFPAVTKDSTIGFGTMVGVAIADKPYGPFVPEATPIQGVYGIDPCTLIDTDGQAYIYWAGMGLMGAKLKENMLELDSEPIQIQTLPEGMKEGPFVFERNGKYYFTFPWVSDKTETLAYAMGDNPLGPFEFTGLIMEQSPTGCWTNHQSIVEYNNQWYLFYHHNDLSPSFDKNRSIRVDSLFFNADGTIQQVTPTLRGVGLTDARKDIQLDRYSRLSDAGAAIDFLNPAKTFDGWKTILSEKNAFVQYNSVDFGKTKVTGGSLRVASVAGGTLLVRVDGENSKPVATVKIPAGAQWNNVSFAVKNVPAGVHNLYVSLENAGNVEIDSIKFK